MTGILRLLFLHTLRIISWLLRNLSRNVCLAALFSIKNYSMRIGIREISWPSMSLMLWCQSNWYLDFTKCKSQSPSCGYGRNRTAVDGRVHGFTLYILRLKYFKISYYIDDTGYKLKTTWNMGLISSCNCHHLDTLNFLRSVISSDFVKSQRILTEESEWVKVPG